MPIEVSVFFTVSGRDNLFDLDTFIILLKILSIITTGIITAQILGVEL